MLWQDPRPTQTCDSALSIPQQPRGSVPPRSGPLPWLGLNCSLQISWWLVLLYGLLALSTLKHPPKGSPGQVKEPTPRELISEDEVPGLLVEGGGML